MATISLANQVEVVPGVIIVINSVTPLSDVMPYMVALLGWLPLTSLVALGPTTSASFSALSSLTKFMSSHCSNF